MEMAYKKLKFMEIKELNKKDYKKAQEFAVNGMHLYWYAKNKFDLKLYSRYFWYESLNRATKAYGAYSDGKLVGVLLSAMKGRPQKYRGIFKTFYLWFFEHLHLFSDSECAETYEQANQKMYEKFCEKCVPDGEITFLAADLNCKIKGIGTALLSAFEKDESGKVVFLYSDDGCTYQFYEHRGFIREGECDVLENINGKKAFLKCFLYAKKIAETV